jgi:hypothetical protein
MKNLICKWSAAALILASLASVKESKVSDLNGEWDTMRAQAWKESQEDVPAPLQGRSTTKSKKSPLIGDSTFDEVRIHLGVSLLQSYQTLTVSPGHEIEGGIRGFQLGLGIDLFSPHWIAQGLLVNYPTASIEDSTLSSSAFELRLLYDYPVLVGVTLHGGAGIGNRFYSVKSPVNEGSFNSGAVSFVAGVEYWPTGEISGGIDLSHHMPMASGQDPSSYDLAIQISGHF